MPRLQKRQDADQKACGLFNIVFDEEEVQLTGVRNFCYNIARLLALNHLLMKRTKLVAWSVTPPTIVH